MSKHLLDFKDTEKKDIEKLIDITGKINPEKVNKISSISLLKFDEPSTRTRLSFSVAAYRLGIKTFESSDLSIFLEWCLLTTIRCTGFLKIKSCIKKLTRTE